MGRVTESRPKRTIVALLLEFVVTGAWAFVDGRFVVDNAAWFLGIGGLGLVAVYFADRIKAFWDFERGLDNGKSPTVRVSNVTLGGEPWKPDCYGLAMSVSLSNPGDKSVAIYRDSWKVFVNDLELQKFVADEDVPISYTTGELITLKEADQIAHLSQRIEAGEIIHGHILCTVPVERRDQFPPHVDALMTVRCEDAFGREIRAEYRIHNH